MMGIVWVDIFHRSQIFIAKCCEEQMTMKWEKFAFKVQTVHIETEHEVIIDLFQTPDILSSSRPMRDLF